MVRRVATTIELYQATTAVWSDLAILRATANRPQDVVDVLLLAAGPLSECLLQLIPESGLDETTESMMSDRCEHHTEIRERRLYAHQHGNLETLEIPEINAIDPTREVTLHHPQWSLDGCLRTHLLVMTTVLIDVIYLQSIRVKVLSATTTAHRDYLQLCHPLRQTDLP
jgi:hypothetical protein